MRPTIFLAAAAAAAAATPAAAQTITQVSTAPKAPVTWTIDPVHSELTFRVRHLLGRVNGTFGEWKGSIVADPAMLSAGQATIEVNVASIDTRNADRDKHLRSADFFDVEKYPTMTFTSRRLVQDGQKLRLEGDLTLHGVTKPVVLTGAYAGKITDPWGKERLAFEASTTINRKDFGLTWSKVQEGVALVGDEVEISVALEAVRN